MEPSESTLTDNEIIQHLWRKSQIYFNSTDDAILRELIRRYQRAKALRPPIE